MRMQTLCTILTLLLSIKIRVKFTHNLGIKSSLWWMLLLLIKFESIYILKLIAFKSFSNWTLLSFLRYIKMLRSMFRNYYFKLIFNISVLFFFNMLLNICVLSYFSYMEKYLHLLNNRLNLIIGPLNISVIAFCSSILAVS